MPDIRKDFESNWLAGHELGDREWVLTMRARDPYTKEEMQGDRGKEVKPVLWFEETKKGLVLNKVNAEVLMTLYGWDTDRWAGHKVAVYFDPNVTFGTKITGGIRIKRAVPDQVDPAQVEQVTQQAVGAMTIDARPMVPATGPDLDDEIPF